MYSFLTKSREKVFLIAEVIGSYFGSEFIYLNLNAGKNKVSVHIDSKVLNSFGQREINFIKMINNKERKFIVALLIDKIVFKKNDCINIKINSKIFINIHEIKSQKH